MRDRITEALSAASGYAEIRVERKAQTAVAFRNGETDKIAASTDIGGCVRALVPGGGWGLVHFNSLENLDQRVREAEASSAAIEPEEPIELADVEPVDMEVVAEITDDPREHSLDEKAEIVRGYEEILRKADERIISSMAMYSDGFSTVWFANTEGSYFRRERLDLVLRVSATAREEDNVQISSESWSSRSSFGVTAGLEDEVKKIGEIAGKLLDSDRVKAGKYTVVLDPTLAGVFIH